MKDYKERFIMFAFNEGSITKKTADKYLNFIEQIISERDKEISEIIKSSGMVGKDFNEEFDPFVAGQVSAVNRIFNQITK